MHARRVGAALDGPFSEEMATLKRLPTRKAQTSMRARSFYHELNHTLVLSRTLEWKRRNATRDSANGMT